MSDSLHISSAGVEEYLWDPGAPAEASVANVERDLAPLKSLPVQLPTLPVRRPWVRPAAAIAACLVLGFLVWQRVTRTPSIPEALGVRSVSGEVTFTREDTASHGEETVIETGVNGRVTMSPEPGWVATLAPHAIAAVWKEDSAWRVTPRAGELFIENGASPVRVQCGDWIVLPRPSSALRVESLADGSMRVTLKTGDVRADAGKGRQVRVGPGMVLTVHPKAGARTPRYHDAPSHFVKVLDALDAAIASGNPQRRNLIEAVLKAARPRDAISLWNLLARTDPPEREIIVMAMTRLKPAAVGGDGPDLKKLEGSALDRVWRAIVEP